MPIACSSACSARSRTTQPADRGDGQTSCSTGGWRASRSSARSAPACIGKIEKHVRPTTGASAGCGQAGHDRCALRIAAPVSEHCRGRRYVERRVGGEHLCDEHTARRKCACAALPPSPSSVDGALGCPRSPPTAASSGGLDIALTATRQQQLRLAGRPDCPEDHALREPPRKRRDESLSARLEPERLPPIR